MALLNTRLFLNNLLHSHVTSHLARKCVEPSVIQIRCYAARKGTRERKEKKKVKHEVKKVGWIPHNLRDQEKMIAMRPKLKFDDSLKKLPLDNVYACKYFRWKIYPFVEAVQCHKETHHPEIYNVPNANLKLRVELNMQGEKKTRFVDNFTRIVAIPHPFAHGEDRSILAFSKDLEMQKEATKAGAQLAGGAELVKQIQNGDVSLHDFQFVIAHPDIVPELVSLRGLLKRKFPNPKTGTLDVDLAGMVSRFLTGINYSAKKDEYEQDFGLIETVIGTLDMKATDLEANFATLIQDINQNRPKRDGAFISRCLLSSLPSKEQLKVDHEIYLKKDVKGKDALQEKDEGEEEEEGERVAL